MPNGSKGRLKGACRHLITLLILREAKDSTDAPTSIAPQRTEAQLPTFRNEPCRYDREDHCRQDSEGREDSTAKSAHEDQPSCDRKQVPSRGRPILSHRGRISTANPLPEAMTHMLSIRLIWLCIADKEVQSLSGLAER
jgi:hypothetical protein